MLEKFTPVCKTFWERKCAAHYFFSVGGESVEDFDRLIQGAIKVTQWQITGKFFTETTIFAYRSVVGARMEKMKKRGSETHSGTGIYFPLKLRMNKKNRQMFPRIPKIDKKMK